MMKKANNVIFTHIATGICILIASILFYHLLTKGRWDFDFSALSGQGTRLEFNVDSGYGFNHDVTVYTDGITSVTLSGEISVEGTAEIIFTSNRDDSIVYKETYRDVKSKIINFDVNNLEPYAYYTLIFSSDDAKKGKLLLTTDQSLVEHPMPPERPKRGK